MVIAIGPVAQVASILLAYFMPIEKYIGRVIGLDFPMMLITVIFLLWLVGHNGRHFRLKYIIYTLKYSLALIPHALSQTLLAQLDLLMISFFIGESAAGIYSMGCTIGLLAYTAMAQIMASWSTWVYRRLDEKQLAPVKKNSALILTIGLLLSIALVFMSPELVTVFLPSDYKYAVYVIMPLVAGNFFQFIYLFFYDIGYYNKKTTAIAAASIITALFNFILNLVFIPMYGFIAAAYTTLASYALLALLNYLIVRHSNVKSIYNLKFMLFLSVICLVLAICAYLLIDYIAIRYMLLAILIIIIFKYSGKRMIQLLKGFRS